MIKASRRVEYGLLALKWMAQKPTQELTTAREVCEQFGVPFDPLARTLQLLHKGGVLEGVHGAHGGYRIKSDLTQLSYSDFSEMILGKTTLIDCLSKCNCDLLKTCNIVHPMTLLNDKLKAFLETITIQELVHANIQLHPIQERRLKAISGGQR
jgi:Rrf2 family protein